MKLNNIVYSFTEFAEAMAKLRNEKHFDYLVTIIGEEERGQRRHLQCHSTVEEREPYGA